MIVGISRTHRHARNCRRGSRTEAKKGRQYTPKPQVQQQYVPKPQGQQQSPPKQLYTGDRKDGTGTTFGGAGKAMDIDEACRKRLCFHCGGEGHIARDCPNKDRKFQVRKMWFGLSETKRAELVKETTSAASPELTPSSSGFPTPQQ